MNNFDYSSLRFDRQTVRPLSRVIWLITAGIGFTLLWLFVPANLLFWVLLPAVLTLTWAASFGWRGALAAIKTAIHTLERL